MTAPLDEAGLRHWLVDYLVTNVGCSPDVIDGDASLNDLGVGSRDAVVLSGELSELLGRPVSPVEFWQYPTVNGLARFLSGGEPDGGVEAVVGRDRGLLDEPIAVVGLGCRFPGGISGPESLWRFLCDGGSAVGQVPSDRWSAFDDGSLGVGAALSGTTRWGSFLSDVGAFDAEFFEVLPREAARMDPQQRLLLEVAWEALEHGGIPPSSLRHSQTGVFVGACVGEYGFLASMDLAGVDAWSNTGGALSIIANRLSYFLDLRGPSLAVDTACSSSLVAVHLACQSLRLGDSDLAIAAGVNLLLSPAVFRGFDQAGALSVTGACRAFDAGADGFVRGEGCGVAVLKRLSDALREGDRVLAVVRGSAVNQDGRSNGLMAPNPAAQMAVLRAAYANAGVGAHEVDYVEAHGTGTLLGDPIEARALGSVLGRGRAVQSPLLVGAVKSNLGHLEAAAGIAGFLKVVLAVQRGAIPPNLHFQTPNPHIPFEQMRLKVVAEHQQWPAVGRVRRAGVSSFGFGGTNAHVVIEQAPAAADVVVSQGVPAVTTLVVSGKSGERIASMAGVLAQWMLGEGADVGLVDVAHTLNHHRERYGRFATVCARDRAQAVAGLQGLAAGRLVEGVVGPHEGACGAGTVFVYSGQGSQWAGMGRGLLADEPAFAAAVAELEPVFVEQVGFSLQRVLAGGEPVRGDGRVQPVLMGLQLALTALWRSYGVHPDAVIGHSMGEVSAAVVAGALSVAEGLRVIAIRGRLMSRLAGQGAVGLVKLDAEATAAVIAGYPRVSLAGYASPRQTVIAGLPEQVDAVLAEVGGQNRFARRVNMEVASHTALMDEILPELAAELAGLSPRTPVIRFFSTVVDPGAAPVLDAQYWVANVREPVRFCDAVAAAGQDHGSFIEISAHPMLTQAISETLESVGHHHSIGTLRRDGDDAVCFHTSLNAAHMVHPRPMPHPGGPHPVLPATPWRHRHHWVDVSRRERVGAPGEVGGVAGGHSVGVVPPEWYCELGWPVRPLSAGQRSASDSWLVVADEAGVGAQIGAVLGGAGGVRMLASSVLSAPVERGVLADALSGVSHVLYAPQGSSSGLDAQVGYRVFNVARRLAAAMAEMALPPRLFLLTRNAQPIGQGDRANPGHAVLWGLGRTLALEHPEVWGAVVDVDESVPAELAAGYLVAEAHSGEGEDQVVYRAGVRHVARLRRVSPPAMPAAGLDKDSAHLVIGATGNIGPHLIGQLAEMGAASIVAVSRRPGSRLQELAHRLSARGTTLTTVAADVCDEAAMSALFERFGSDLPPLGGIYLAAFGGGPVTLRDMTDDDVSAMFAPKLDAVWLLHRLSLNQPVARFVLFSSISGVLGSRWLGHYAATTTFLDTFAYARRAAGLCGTAINWGLWKSLAEHQDDQQLRVTLESGLQPMADELAIQALPALSGPDAAPRSTIVAADWVRLATAYRTRAALHIIDDLVPAGVDNHSDATATPTTDVRQALSNCQPARRRALLAEHVTTLVATVMGLESAQSLDPSVGFFQFGMDSLMSVTLQRALTETLGLTVPASVVFDYPTVDALTDYLATNLPELHTPTDQHNPDNYDNLTEAESSHGSGEESSQRVSGEESSQHVSGEESSRQASDEGRGAVTPDSASSLLDALFDSVESAPAGTESGI